jgi:hypothetical protein
MELAGLEPATSWVRCGSEMRHRASGGDWSHFPGPKMDWSYLAANGRGAKWGQAATTSFSAARG